MVEPENIVLSYLRKIDETVSRIADDVRDLKVRVTAVEAGQAGIHRRLDRMDERLDRLEKRLELADA